MRTRKKSIMIWLIVLLVLYVGSFVGIKLAKPESLTSNNRPCRIYCATYLPLRFLTASFESDYWRNFLQGNWRSVRYLGFNPGNGYLDIEYLDGQQGRAWSGRDIDGVKTGEIWQIHFSYALETWDDFSDHLIATVDRSRRPN